MPLQYKLRVDTVVKLEPLVKEAAANQEGGVWVVKGEYVACHRGIRQTPGPGVSAAHTGSPAEFSGTLGNF